MWLIFLFLCYYLVFLFCISFPFPLRWVDLIDKNIGDRHILDKLLLQPDPFSHYIVICIQLVFFFYDD